MAVDHVHGFRKKTMNDSTPKIPSEFEQAAAHRQGESLLSEFWLFLAQNKKWWLLPIVIVMLLLGTLIPAVEHSRRARSFTRCFESGAWPLRARAARSVG